MCIDVLNCEMHETSGRAVLQRTAAEVLTAALDTIVLFHQMDCSILSDVSEYARHEGMSQALFFH